MSNLPPSRLSLFRLWGLWTLAYSAGAAVLGEFLIWSLRWNGDLWVDSVAEHGLAGAVGRLLAGVGLVTVGAVFDGVLQGLALRNHVPSGRQWAVATAIPLAVGLNLPLLAPGSQFANILIWWFLAFVPSCMIAAQYVLWRRWVRRPWLWAVLGLPAWALTGVALVVVGMYSTLGISWWSNGESMPWGLGLFNGLIDGAIAGALKGGIVVWLVRSRSQPVPEATPPTVD